MFLSILVPIRNQYEIIFVFDLYTRLSLDLHVGLICFIPGDVRGHSSKHRDL